jgi:hypothetical protein
MTYVLGFVDAMNVRKLDGFPLHWFELSLTGTSLHKARIFEKNSKNNEKN